MTEELGLFPLGSGVQEGKGEFFCFLWCSLSHQGFLYSDFVFGILYLECAFLRHSLAHSFTPFRSFPNVTSTGTSLGCLLKTGTSQSFFSPSPPIPLYTVNTYMLSLSTLLFCPASYSLTSMKAGALSYSPVNF